jgi:hypothetical protein
MMLVADRYGVTLLRDRCLHALAARFGALVQDRAPAHEREVLEAFIAAVAPKVAPITLAGLPSAMAMQMHLRTLGGLDVRALHLLTTLQSAGNSPSSVMTVLAGRRGPV